MRYSARGHRTAPEHRRRPAARRPDRACARRPETTVRPRDARRRRVLRLGALRVRRLPGAEHVPTPGGAAERWARLDPPRREHRLLPARGPARPRGLPVSYTHLTLPTIYSV